MPITVSPADWPLAAAADRVVAVGIGAPRAGQTGAACDLVADALAVDDRAWLRLAPAGTAGC